MEESIDHILLVQALELLEKAEISITSAYAYDFMTDAMAILYKLKRRMESSGLPRRRDLTVAELIRDG